MGHAAGAGSDYVVLTSDNPRSEPPQAILDEILPALQLTGASYTAEPDRAAAIGLALAAARPHDIVLIAGKGHEKTQTIGAEIFPFDDAVVARRVLADLGYEAPA
jgi:UDP-N-acetylmuramoyl-L-alanyl-D-glutamate--2,6-diaminopimelate ligase